MVAKLELFLEIWLWVERVAKTDLVHHAQRHISIKINKVVKDMISCHLH